MLTIIIVVIIVVIIILVKRVKKHIKKSNCDKTKTTYSNPYKILIKNCDIEKITRTKQ